MRYALLLLLTWVLAAACQGQENTETYPEPYYRAGSRSYDGTGKYYMGREISQVMGHLGASWLEREERSQEEGVPLALDALDEMLPDDATVADIGAGSGYYAFRIAERIPDGQVLAVDIQPEMLALIRQKQTETGIDRVVPILGSITDPNLPADSLDLVFMVDVYHEFSHPREMMQALVRALKPGGRVVLLEYRAEDPSVPIKPRHKMSAEQARKEMEAVGLRFVANQDMMPWQHFLVFEKVAP